MALRTTVQTPDRSYLVVDAGIAPQRRALLQMHITDAISGEPWRGDLRLCLEPPELVIHRRWDFVGVSVDATWLDLVLQRPPLTIELAVQAPRSTDRTVSVTLHSDANLPLDLGNVLLRRMPVSLQGRVVEETAARLPIAGARISSINGPGGVPPSALLRSPTGFLHPVNTPVRETQLVPNGPVRQTAIEGRAGDRAVVLSNRQTLVAGSVLQIGIPSAACLVTVAQLDPAPADPSQQGRATLVEPLPRSYAAGTPVQLLNVAPGGLVQNLRLESAAGSGLLALGGFLPVASALIDDANPARREHVLLDALTDADGFFAIWGINDALDLHLRASSPAHQPMPAPLAHRPDYDRPVNVLNFRLRP